MYAALLDPSLVRLDRLLRLVLTLLMSIELGSEEPRDDRSWVPARTRDLHPLTSAAAAANGVAAGPSLFGAFGDIGRARGLLGEIGRVALWDNCWTWVDRGDGGGSLDSDCCEGGGLVGGGLVALVFVGTVEAEAESWC